jgi:O-antigen ligase
VPSRGPAWLSAIHLGYGLLLPLAALLKPLLLIPLAVGAGLVAAGVVWQRRGRFPWPAPTLVLLCLLTLAWTAIAMAWTFDPAGAFGRWLNLPLLLLALLLLAGAGHRYPADLAGALLRGLAIGFSLGALVILIEWLGGSPLITFLRPADDQPRHPLDELGRGLAFGTLAVWALVAWLGGRGRRWAWLLPLLLLPPALLLQHLASAFSVLTGIALALLTLWRPRLGRALLLLLPAAILLLGPPLFIRLYGWGLMDSESLPSTARYRVQIWWFTSERILEKPLWGWGYDAARRMPDFGVDPYGGKPHVIPTHPHQAFLQAWLELGLPGLLLAWGWFPLAWRGLAGLPRQTQSAALGLTGGVIAVAATAFGLWQGHTLAILVLAPALLLLALRTLNQAGDLGEAPRQVDGEAGPRQG